MKSAPGTIKILMKSDFSSSDLIPFLAVIEGAGPSQRDKVTPLLVIHEPYDPTSLKTKSPPMMIPGAINGKSEGAWFRGPMSRMTSWLANSPAVCRNESVMWYLSREKY